ncbi:MAG: hypothetical protein ABI847_20290 [Anaerolineales bacterium]
MTIPGDTQPIQPVPRPPQEPAPVPPVSPPPAPPVRVTGTVGGSVAGRDIHTDQNAGRDIVGRDVVTTTSNTTTVGFSAAAVQRLIITVGVLVFVTAACFFSGGLVVGGAALAALERPVNSTSEAAAARFADKLRVVSALPAGQAFQLTFTEEEISSYFRLVVAPTMPGDITNGKVRLLDNGDLVVGGQAGVLRKANFAATFAWQDEPGQPLRLKGAAIRLLPGETESAFGYIAVPGFVLRPVTDQVNSLFAGVQFTNVVPGHTDTQPAWQVNGVGR